MPRNAKGYHYQPYQRQRPVSCHFCRTRKLRCNRENPCSNCSARGITCRLYAPDVRRCAADQIGLVERSNVPDSHNDPSQSQGILNRLERLEQALLSNTSTTTTSLPPWTGNTIAARKPITPLPTGNRTRFGSVGKEPQLATDAEILEMECVDQCCEVLFIPETILFKTCPISQITKSQSYIFLPPSDPTSSSTTEPTKCIWLPSYPEATLLIEKYLKDLTHVHHVIHVPSIRLLVEDLYHQLAAANQNAINLDPEKVSLVLAMLTSAIHSQDLPMANSQAIIFTTSTLSVLAHCKSAGPGSLEEIQAMIILSFVVSHLEGLSRRFWSLHADAITTARSLGLHLIDDEHHELLKSGPPRDSIRAEMGRRVWWYLVATDWMFSRYPGPSEGLYTVNPLHMCVRQPLNVDDEDLCDGMEHSQINKPLSQPTVMSYNLQRIRLAKICLEITESTPFNVRGLTHERIIEIDGKIEAFINTVPEFLKLDEHRTSVATTNVEPVDRFSPGIVIQRYILNSLLLAQRCKFHLQYLGRMSSAAEKNSVEYNASREICLNTARLIIRLERALEHENVAFAKVRLKFSGVLYCVFMATMVLALDLCLNKRATTKGNNPNCEEHGYNQSESVDEERKAELVHACRILAQAREESLMAARVLDSLLRTLKRHQLAIPSLDRPSTATGDGPKTLSSSAVNMPTDSPITAPTTVDDELKSMDDGIAIASTAGHKDIVNDLPDLSYLDELWNTFNDGIDFETLCQGGWFSGMDSQF